MKRGELIQQLRLALHMLESPKYESPVEFDIMDTTFEPVFDDEETE